MRRNRLRELLREGRPSIGTHLAISWPSIVELVGHSRMFDYVEFLAEYAPYDLYALENLGRAVDLFPHMTGMMKVEQEPRTYLAVRAIGSGIQNVLFADIRTVADAQAAVRAVRAEAPRSGGIHGVGHAARRGPRDGGRHAGLRAGAGRRGGGAHDREEAGGGGPRRHPRPCPAWTWCSSAPRTTR